MLWTTVGRKHRNRRNERGRGVHNKNSQDVWNWHACKLDLDVTCIGNGWTNAQRGIFIFFTQEANAIIGCEKPRLDNDGALRLFPRDWWTALHSLLSRRTPNTMKPEATTPPSGSLSLTPWPVPCVAPSVAVLSRCAWHLLAPVFLFIFFNFFSSPCNLFPRTHFMLSMVFLTAVEHVHLQSTVILGVDLS